MVTWSIKKLDKESEKVYENNKTNFTSNLNKSIQDTLDNMEKVEVEGDVKEGGVKGELTELQKKIAEYWEKGMKQKDIAIELNENPAKISLNEKFMRNKGYYRKKYQK